MEYQSQDYEEEEEDEFDDTSIFRVSKKELNRTLDF